MRKSWIQVVALLEAKSLAIQVIIAKELRGGLSESVSLYQ
jgi:hypothetical protein